MRRSQGARDFEYRSVLKETFRLSESRTSLLVMLNFSIKRVQCKLACKLPSERKVDEVNVRKVSEAT